MSSEEGVLQKQQGNPLDDLSRFGNKNSRCARSAAIHGIFDAIRRRAAAFLNQRGPWELLLDDFLPFLFLGICSIIILWRPYLAGASPFVVAITAWLIYRVIPSSAHSRKLGIRVVCISDTHGAHREFDTDHLLDGRGAVRDSKIKLPDGDVLIHGGDFTTFGSETDARDFNEWLGELKGRGYSFRKIIVVVGNHENNSKLKGAIINRRKEGDRSCAVDGDDGGAAGISLSIDSLITNAVVLKNQVASVRVVDLKHGDANSTSIVSIYGCDFSWPIKTSSAGTLYDTVPRGVDVVVAHSPARGMVDGGMGCPALLRCMARCRPRLLVGGHIHRAHGVSKGFGCCRGTTFVNASSVVGGEEGEVEVRTGRRQGQKIGRAPVVVNL